MDADVAIIGGGLAGLAAAVALAPHGFRVTVLEARNRLGGRAGSFTDTTSGQLIDACQHVTMGCCTNYEHFCRTLEISQFLQPQPCLYFMTPDRRVSRLAAGPWPAPFHWTRGFLGAHYLTATDKLRIAWGLARLRSADAVDDSPFTDWLAQHRQTPRTVERFWGVVLTSALNETPDRIGLRYARKVFVDGFMRHRRGFEVTLPTVPLGRLYGEEMNRWFATHDVCIRLNTGAKHIQIADDRVEGLELRNGECVRARWYIAASPFDRLLDLLPPTVVSNQPLFANLRNLETSPITSVHLWYDRPVIFYPHVVLIDCIGQWVFNRGATSTGEHYVQIVVSAARQFRGLGHDVVSEKVVDEMHRLFPRANPTALLRSRIVTEHAATFSAIPGVDRWRPTQTTPIRNLLLAGDWTATGWPATMEGAVRSGYLAAEAILREHGITELVLQPDL